MREDKIQKIYEDTILNKVNEKEGMMLPYLKKMVAQLGAVEKNMRVSMNLKGDNVVSSQEIKLMNQIKDKVSSLQKLLDEGPDFA